MRIPILLAAAWFVSLSGATSLRHPPIGPHVLRSNGKRDLPGLLSGWDNDNSGTGSGSLDDGSLGQDPTDSRTTDTALQTDTFPLGLLQPLTTANSSTTSKTRAATTTDTQVPVTSAFTSQPTSTSPSVLSALSATSTSTTSSTPGQNLSATSSSSSGTSTWKIVGVAVISFTVVSVILIGAVCFDHWWTYMKRAFGMKHTEEGEELVPDWEKASWEVRFGDDRHRYPSFASLPSGQPHREPSVKVKEYMNNKRLSASERGLTSGERLVLSPGYVPPSAPGNAYLNPTARPNPGNVSPSSFIQNVSQSHSPSAEPVQRNASVRSQASSQHGDPFADQQRSAAASTGLALTGVYEGIDGRR